MSRKGKELIALESTFRSVLGRGAGVEVLATILESLGLFQIINTDDDVSRHNVAIELLTMCKVIIPDDNDETRLANMRQLANMLLSERA